MTGKLGMKIKIAVQHYSTKFISELAYGLGSLHSTVYAILKFIEWASEAWKSQPLATH